MSEVHPWAQLIGSMKDDPTWDEYMANIAENRRIANDMYAEDEEGTRPTTAWGTPESLREVIRHFCSRPKMFFRNGLFSEFAYFVDGYAMGRGGRAAEELTAFRQWLAERAYEVDGAARNLAWVCYIEQLYPDDERAFAELPTLFDLFQSERYLVQPL